MDVLGAIYSQYQLKSLWEVGLPYSCGYLERVLLRRLDLPKLDPKSTSCEYFELVVFFLQNYNDV
jgi:hypothetical protein